MDTVAELQAEVRALRALVAHIITDEMAVRCDIADRRTYIERATDAVLGWDPRAKALAAEVLDTATARAQYVNRIAYRSERSDAAVTMA